MRTIFMFSGQGSHYAQMGRELHQQDSIFRTWLERCSEIAAPELGFWLTERLYSGSPDAEGAFRRTAVTGAAIFSVSFSLAQTLMVRGIRPDLLLGYSLGEFISLAVGGVWSLESALTAIIRSSQTIDRFAPPAALTAVLAPLSAFEGELAGVHLACRNFSKGHVVAGAPGAIAAFEERLERRGVLTSRIPVERGFHSPLIDVVEEDYKTRFQALDGRGGWARVHSCALGRVLERSDVGPDYGWKVVRGFVDFDRALRTLEQEGPSLYVDVGPSGTLAAIVREALGRNGGSRAVTILDPFGRNMDGLAKALQAWKAR